MSDALNMCAESGLPFNISDFRPWVTKEDFKNSRKAVNASSRSYRSSVDDDIRVLQQYHESVAFPSTYIRTCEMANTTKLQELEFMVISPKMLAFAKANRGVLYVLHYPPLRFYIAKYMISKYIYSPIFPRPDWRTREPRRPDDGDEDFHQEEVWESEQRWNMAHGGDADAAKCSQSMLPSMYVVVDEVGPRARTQGPGPRSGQVLT